MSASTQPAEVPEVPRPVIVPEVTPTINPEQPQVPKEEPAVIPHEAPFQPDIPNEIPPFKP